jgi:hypothetical protein
MAAIATATVTIPACQLHLRVLHDELTEDDEEPSPTFEALGSTDSGECRSGDQAAERGGENVGGVQDTDSKSDLLSGVEQTKQIDSSRVERGCTIS